jgi:multidrug efflux pump subunit AcrB
MGGFLFRPLTLAVAFAMLSSFVLSRTLVPALCAKWLPKHHQHSEEAPAGLGGRLHHRLERALNFVTKRYECVLAAALRRRAIVLTAVALLFVGSLCLIFGIGREFFPQIDAGQITIYVRCPSGTNIEATEQRIVRVEHFLVDQIPGHDRKMIISELGLVPDWSAAYSPNSGTQDAVIKVQLSDERTKTSQEYARELRHAFQENHDFDDLRVSFDTGGIVSAALNYGASSPIDIQIEGGSLTQGLDIAQKIRNQVADLPGAADVHIQQRLDAQQRIIEIDRQKTADAGLDTCSVINQVATALNSSVAIKRNFWIDYKTGNQYFVAVQYREDPHMKLEELLDIPATGANQSHPTKLSTLVHLKPSTAPVEVNHVGLARVFDVLVNTEGRDIGSLASDITKRLETLQQKEWARQENESQKPEKLEDKGLIYPNGMRVNLRGEYARMNESFGNLGAGLVFAAVLVYLLLVVLFRSFQGPFIIMFAVPLGLIGVLTMLFITGTTLNVQSCMGVIFMVGIVVSNGVLLVDFANKQRKQGASVKEAITTAAAIRFRPIMMTFLATFLDLTPMAIGIGKGSEANVPLARAVVGGLLTSTCLTLIVVPIIYTLLLKDKPDMEAEVDRQLARSEFAAALGYVVELPALAARANGEAPTNAVVSGQIDTS